MGRSLLGFDPQVEAKHYQASGKLAWIEVDAGDKEYSCLAVGISSGTLSESCGILCRHCANLKYQLLYSLICKNSIDDTIEHVNLDSCL